MSETTGKFVELLGGWRLEILRGPATETYTWRMFAPRSRPAFGVKLSMAMGGFTSASEAHLDGVRMHSTRFAPEP